MHAARHREHSRPGEPVYDPFVGSGTTIIAATIAGRVALALEIDPLYVDLAVRRWQTSAAPACRATIAHSTTSR